jgi:hypothetical protein
MLKATLVTAEAFVEAARAEFASHSQFESREASLQRRDDLEDDSAGPASNSDAASAADQAGSVGESAEKRRRSLGKRATEVLTQWFFAHLSDPYPSEEDKARLCQDCGMSMNQINNWFGNKRMRYKRKVLGPLRTQTHEAAGSPDSGPGKLWRSKSGRHPSMDAADGQVFDGGM